MELADIVLSAGQIVFGCYFRLLEQFTSAHDLHALARCAQKGHHRLVHLCGLIPHDDGILVRFQVIHLDDGQSVVCQPLLLVFVVHAVNGKKDAWQVHCVFFVIHDDLSVARPLRFQELIVQSQSEHFLLQLTLTDHFSEVLQLDAVDHFLLP